MGTNRVNTDAFLIPGRIVPLLAADFTGMATDTFI